MISHEPSSPAPWMTCNDTPAPTRVTGSLTLQPPAVGLEAITLEIPRHYLELSDLALARGVDPEKYLRGLGQKQMAVALPTQDSVTLATNASLRLFESYPLSPADIGLVIVGTETGIDHSKPISAYVHEQLALPSACRTYEIKHACYGAMAAIHQAANWISSGRARGRKALVIASDVAYYGLNTPGEPTQGAGAVAMVISDHPDLLELDFVHEGFYAKQVMDFWRPLYRKSAIADGHYSIRCYLEALEHSYRNFRGEAGAGFYERFGAILYHAPFFKMAQKAHIKLIEADLGHPLVKNSQEAHQADLDFQNRVAPWLELNSRVGNIYTGSVFMSLYAYLQHAQENTLQTPAGTPVGIFSYGSGCAAEFMGGFVGHRLEHLAQFPRLGDILNQRRRLSVPEYEAIMTQYLLSDQNDALPLDPALWDAHQDLVYLGTQHHQRQYRRMEPLEYKETIAQRIAENSHPNP